MPTILITGANGFLARTVASLAPPDWRTIGLVRAAGAPDADRHWHALHDSIDVLAAAERKVDVVLHLAARIPADMQQSGPELIASNVALPAQLLMQYPDARHVLASSVAVFGQPASLPLSVAAAPAPATAYGWSKLAAENLARMAPSHAILRLSSIIGRGMRAGSFIPAAVAAARSGRITVHGNGSRTQDYIDVRDAARMCIEAAQRHDNFVTLAVSGREHSNREVASELAALTGAEIEFTGHDASASFAYTMAGAVALGPPRYALHETLGQMVAE